MLVSQYTYFTIMTMRIGLFTFLCSFSCFIYYWPNFNNN